jgi:hypothetical protein
VDTIKEWQARMGAATFSTAVCAVCAWCVVPSDVADVHPDTFDLTLLCNDYLPLHVFPTTYDRSVYKNMILCARGMHSTTSMDCLSVCSVCRSALLGRKGKQPKYALANFLYYGHESLPIDMASAFASASPFNLLLVSRARSSVVMHHYIRRGYSGGYVPEECSQRFNRGNVAVFPQEPGHLRSVLPPSGEDIRDTVCVMFTGGSQKPTVDTLKMFRPVLVSKRKVQTMVEFLVSSNEWYTSDGITYSQANMDDLFSKADADDDAGVLQHMQIIHVSDTDSPEDVNWQEFQETILTENVAYTEGDYSSCSREAMKVHTLAHALDHKPFIQSHAGSSYISDGHFGLMAYMFPHLDPWGIGGFHHPGRNISCTLSFESQVKCLLCQSESRFAQDDNFAFICWNMLQKQVVSTCNTFSIHTKCRRDLSEQLHAVAPHMTEIVNKWEKDPFSSVLTQEEKSILSLLRHINLTSKNLRGSAGYKLCRRNKIRALIRKFSTPALFITINPHDISLNVLASCAEIPHSVWEAMSAYERSAFVAKHPDVAACAFDMQIRSFIDVVVHYGRGSGLFRTCDTYYGMIEAQGRGSLHCHMLLWLSGSLSPQVLRDHTSSDPDFKRRLFAWLEDIIHCELPGTHEPVSVTDELL